MKLLLTSQNSLLTSCKQEEWMEILSIVSSINSLLHKFNFDWKHWKFEEVEQNVSKNNEIEVLDK